jgi:ABC-type glycerol-3-phosphate transport system substrate-binding protein
MEKALGDQLSRVLRNEIDPTEALAKAQKALEAIVANRAD